MGSQECVGLHFVIYCAFTVLLSTEHHSNTGGVVRGPWGRGGRKREGELAARRGGVLVVRGGLANIEVEFS